ncbi:MAG: hypothetical protein ACK58L_06325 [Planctomycetota bacterium]
MRFRSKGQPRGLLTSRDQTRARLVILGVALLAITASALGENSWFVRMFAAPEPKAQSAATAAAERLMNSSTLRPDEFEIASEADPTKPVDYASMIDRQGAAQMEAGPPQNASTAGDVPVRLTQMIKDDVLGILSSETEAWLGTLRLARNLTPTQKQLLPEGQYASFMDAPQICRGKAYVIRGTLRRLIEAPLPIGAEDYGIRSAYEAWISTRDSGHQLVRVIALSASGVPEGELGKNGPAVEVAGFFFKRQGYEAKGKDGRGVIMLAPLILTARITGIPPRVIESYSEKMYPWLTGIGLCICAGVLLLIWQFQASDHMFRGTRTFQLTNPPVKPSFDGVNAVTVPEALQQMQDNARSNSPDTTLLSNVDP